MGLGIKSENALVTGRRASYDTDSSLPLNEPPVGRLLNEIATVGKVGTLDNCYSRCFNFPLPFHGSVTPETSAGLWLMCPVCLLSGRKECWGFFFMERLLDRKDMVELLRCSFVKSFQVLV